MKYKMTLGQEARFEELYSKYQDKIRLAVYKCNISPNNFEHYYSHAFEGFLQAFLIMEAGDISQADFPAFAFSTMKRKVIDELRKSARNRDVATDLDHNYSNLAYNDSRMDDYIMRSSILDTLNEKERRIFSYIDQGYSYKEISEEESMSKSKYYNILSSIKSKVSHLLYK